MNIFAGQNLFQQTTGPSNHDQSIPGAARDAYEPFPMAELAQSIPDRFERQVRRYPDKLAAKDQIGSTVTYTELNDAANRIGRSVLAAIGDGEKPVVIMVEQSVGLLASIMGTLKAGKFYVPVESGYSAARIKQVLGDTATPLLLTDTANHAAAVDLGEGILQVINIDDIPDNSPSGNIGLKLSPDRPAYIYYTSGTTGQPKGVVDCHRNVLHNVYRYTNKLCIGSDDRLSLVQSPGFSGAISNVFCALLNGASVFPYDLRRDGGSGMANWVEREELTMFHAVPAVYEWLFSGGHGFRRLRVIRLEGDQAFKQHLDLFKERFYAGCSLVVGLGTSETGIATQFVFNADDDLCDDIVPIGYATKDFTVRLLDEAEREVGRGEVGQIAVESRYLATGYWNRPELMRAAFRNGTDSRPERTYLTGDLGRMRPDNCLEYLGRKNFQARIRGQLVDMPMVEQAIRNLPGIKSAAVAFRKDGFGRDRLIAYIVPLDQASISVTNLRSELSDKLHGPSLPTAFVPMIELPLNENCKIDHGALPPLPALPRNRPQLDVDYEPPRNSVDVHMKKLWEDVLEVEPVGIHDDFYDLGGDSLIAENLFLGIEQIFGKILPVDTLWAEGATIEHVVSVLRRADESIIWNSAVPLKPTGSRLPLFVIHTFGGHLSPYIQFSRLLNSEQPVYGLQARGADGTGVPQFSISEMAGHCIEMMRKLQPSGPYRIAGYSSGGLIAYEMARALAECGEQVSHLILLDAILPQSGLLGHSRSLSTEFRARDYRLLQERLYFLILHSLGLDRLRKLQTVMESHRWAEFCYRPGRYSGGVLLIQSSETAESNSYEQRWKSLISGDIELETVEGDHLSIMRSSALQHLADCVTAHLID